jgi:uncharacterized Zn finger protein (UPF0148 family)
VTREEAINWISARICSVDTEEFEEAIAALSAPVELAAGETCCPTCGMHQRTDAANEVAADDAERARAYREADEIVEACAEAAAAAAGSPPHGTLASAVRRLKGRFALSVPADVLGVSPPDASRRKASMSTTTEQRLRARQCGGIVAQVVDELDAAEAEIARLRVDVEMLRARGTVGPKVEGRIAIK